MTKKKFFFKHDYDARNDPKIVRLMADLGMRGVGIYWCLVEKLYQEGGYIATEHLNSVAFELHEEYKCITNVLSLYNLFQNDGEKYWSESVLRRIEETKNVSEKRKNAINSRWKNTNVSKTDTNVIQNRYKSDTNIRIIEYNNKENIPSLRSGTEKKAAPAGAVATHSQILSKTEIKIQKRIEREKEFVEELRPYVAIYGRDMVNAFYKYWTEPTKSKTLNRKDQQKTWDTERRLETWAKRERSNGVDKSEKSMESLRHGMVDLVREKYLTDQPVTWSPYCDEDIQNGRKLHSEVSSEQPGQHTGSTDGA